MIFNGVDVRQLDKKISIEKEIPPGAPTRSIRTVHGRTGDIFAGVDYGAAEYIARINIAGSNPKKAWEVRNKIAAWAMTDEPKRLIPTHWPGRYYEAICTEIGNPEFVRGFGTLEVRFVLPKPYAYSIDERTVAFDGEMHVAIGGDISPLPVITQTISAATNNLVFTLDGTAFITLFNPSGNFGAGNSFIFDFSDNSVIWNGQHAEYLIDFSGTNWHPNFKPGAHRITSSSPGTKTMRWRDIWM